MEFKGKEIRLKFDEARSEYYLSFTQTKFIEALEVPKIKGKGEETLQPADLPDYRSVSGSLQWVSGQTRPDVAATISLCSKGSKATYKDLGLMCDAIKFLKQTKDEGFNMYPTALMETRFWFPMQILRGRTQKALQVNMAVWFYFQTQESQNRFDMEPWLTGSLGVQAESADQHLQQKQWRRTHRLTDLFI